jgi:hypothetical protein
MKITPWLLPVFTLAACGGGGGSTGTNGSPTGGGSTGGSGGSGWTIVPLDASDGGDQSDLALAVGPGDTVGVAYYLSQPQPATSDFQPYQIRYVQYAAGAVTAPTIVAGEGDAGIAHPEYGLGLAISPSGQPAVAFLGGASYGTGSAASIYWPQSQAMVSYQQANGSWTQEVADNAQADQVAQTVNGVNDGMTDYGATGVVVLGLFSAIGFDSTGVAYDYFRDVHFGQSIGTTGDFAAANINGEIGGPTSWQAEWAFAGNTWVNDGSTVLGLGGHNQLVMANDQPAIACDEFDSSAGDNSSGQNVDFTMRVASMPLSDWSLPQRILSVGATQTGPSLAFNATFGYAVTVYDTTKDQLLFTSSTDGVTWAKADDVFAGPGGWFPSVAISPVSNKPAIADFLCSNQPGPTAIGECPTTEQAIEVRAFSGNSFSPGAVVDPAGGFEPKIGFLSTGKMVIQQ